MPKSERTKHVYSEATCGDQIGQCYGCACECVSLLFEAIPKARRAENIGVLNEVFTYLARHKPAV